MNFGQREGQKKEQVTNGGFHVLKI